MIAGRDLLSGGKIKQEETVAELIARSYTTVDDDDRPRRVPRLINGRWVHQEIDAAATTRRHAPPSTLPKSMGGGAGLREFEVSLEGSAQLGITLKELDGSSSGDAQPPSGYKICLLYTSPSPRDRTRSRMPSSA